MEVWKDIKGYEGLYEVSNKGRVFSYINNRLLKIQEATYPRVSLKKMELQKHCKFID